MRDGVLGVSVCAYMHGHPITSGQSRRVAVYTSYFHASWVRVAMSSSLMPLQYYSVPNDNSNEVLFHCWISFPNKLVSTQIKSDQSTGLKKKNPLTVCV